jgi:hypothetical protein
MTKTTFIIGSVLYLAATLIFCYVLYLEHPTLSMAVGSLAIVAWGCIKIAIEANGFKPFRRKNGPQTF